MTDVEIQKHYETMADFVEAIESGEPVNNELCQLVWLTWTVLDENAGQLCRAIDADNNALRAQLAQLHFTDLTDIGNA